MAITPGVILPLIGPVPTPGPSTAIAPPTIVTITPSSAFEGSLIIINGTGFTGTTSIDFGNFGPGVMAPGSGPPLTLPEELGLGTPFIIVATQIFFAVNSDSQISLIVPSTNEVTTSFLRVNTTAGSVIARFDVIIDVTWDASGCNLLSLIDGTFTKCPVIANFPGFNNVSVGVDISFSNLRIAGDGVANQGGCVNPLYAKSGTQTFYWEIKWLDLSSPPGGLGFCDISAISNWGAFGATGVGGFLLKPDGSTWINGTRMTIQPGGQNYFPLQKAGDTVGIAGTINSDGSISGIFIGVGGSILPSEMSTISSGPGIATAIVPCISMVNNSSALALFSQRDQTAFLGPKNISGFFGLIPGVANGVLGWPGTLDPSPPP